MFGFSMMHWVIVLVIVMMLFGAGKIPTVMKDLGQGMRQLRKGLSEADEAQKEIAHD